MSRIKGQQDRAAGGQGGIVTEEYETVERPPKPVLGQRNKSFLSAVLQTATTGKALRLPKQQALSLRGYMYAVVRGYGLQLRTKSDGHHLLVWCETPEKEGGAS